MRQFKFPLIVTGIALAIALIVAVVIITVIHNSKGSSRQKAERAAMAGSGVGLTTVIVVAPFWLTTAARIGKQRRAERENQKRPK